MSDEETSEEQLVKVETLTPSSRAVAIIVKVVSKSEVRNVESRYGSHRVADATVGDETGSIILTLWDDNIEQIDTEDTIKISNGYVNLFRGNMRLNIGKYGTFETIEGSPISDVNTENNMSEKTYEQERRFRSNRPRYGERRSYQRRRY